MFEDFLKHMLREICKNRASTCCRTPAKFAFAPSKHRCKSYSGGYTGWPITAWTFQKILHFPSLTPKMFIAFDLG